MPNRYRHSLAPLIGYHGCEKDLVEDVLNHHASLTSSTNIWDWLGPGAYFWIDSPERAARWAEEQKARGKIKKPAVLGAYINPGLCLNLIDIGVGEEIKVAYEFLAKTTKSAGGSLPENSGKRDGIHLNRKLDCAVFRAVHKLREMSGEPPYDTVYGVFEEGGPLFPGSDIKEKTHVQIAVINPNAVVGYFKPMLA